MDRQQLHGAVVFIHILLRLGLGFAHRGCPEVTADLAATTWELLIRLEIDSAVAPVTRDDAFLVNMKNN